MDDHRGVYHVVVPQLRSLLVPHRRCPHARMPASGPGCKRPRRLKPCVQMQHYHVTVTLLLALADALTVATAAATGATTATASDDQQRQQVLAAGAAGLTASILPRRLKALYFNLSSDVRGKANAALTLLTALASSGGSAGARELVRVFDWSLSALAGLARPPRCAQRRHGVPAITWCCCPLNAGAWQQ